MNLVHSFTFLYTLQVWSCRQNILENSNETKTLQHYNIITSFVTYKNNIIYPINKIFIVFIKYLLSILLTTYYLGYIPTIYYLTYI
jgi:hypothetical protein